METCGHTSWEVLKRALPYLDLVLFDLKAVDSDLHRRLTGQGNARILENLERLVACGAHVIPRIPLIPTMNDTEDNLVAMARLLSDLGLAEVHLMPYHRLGESKLSHLDSPLCSLDLPELTEQEKENAAEVFRSRGLRVVMGGA